MNVGEARSRAKEIKSKTAGKLIVEGEVPEMVF